MADVYAVFGSLLALGLVFPGLLAAMWLLFPQMAEASSRRLAAGPWRSVFAGIAAAVVAGIPIGILLAIPAGPVKAIGVIGLLGLLALAAIGAAGLAAGIGRRLATRSKGGMSDAASFARGAIILELAAAFPAIGWFLIVPVVAIASLGAAVGAVLDRRRHPAPAPSQEPAAQGA